MPAQRPPSDGFHLIPMDMDSMPYGISFSDDPIEFSPMLLARMTRDGGARAGQIASGDYDTLIGAGLLYSPGGFDRSGRDASSLRVFASAGYERRMTVAMARPVGGPRSEAGFYAGIGVRSSF